MRPTPAGQALLDTFDRIVIINLAHRTDRLREIRAEFARLGLSLDHPQILRFDACRFDQPEGFPTAGTRGCFHSHLNVWREAVARGDRAVLLIEDDLDFSPDIDAQLPAILERLRAEDWSVFYGAILQWARAAEPLPPLTPARPEESVMGGHFIALTGEALAGMPAYLDAILSRPPGSPEGGPMHVDGAYGWFRRANPHLATFIARPDQGQQRRSRTDIHALGFVDRTPVLRELAAMARRVKRAL